MESILIVLAAIFCAAAGYVCIVGTTEHMVFNEESEEWEEVDDGTLFIKRFHGLAITDFKPGMGHTFLTTTILAVTAESLTLGAYDFACPAGQEEACGYVQTGLVGFISVVIVVILSTSKPYLDGDDQLVEEVSAWCKVATLIFVLLLPVSKGSEAQSFVSWGIIFAQGVSLANQLWYNLKPLLSMIPGCVTWLCCPAPATNAEEIMDIKRRGSESLGHKPERTSNPLTALDVAERWAYVAKMSKANSAEGQSKALASAAHKWRFKARNLTHERAKRDALNVGSAGYL